MTWMDFQKMYLLLCRVFLKTNKPIEPLAEYYLLVKAEYEKNGLTEGVRKDVYALFNVIRKTIYGMDKGVL